MKEINSVVTENYFFNNRDESFLLTFFCKFGTITLLMEGSLSIVFQLNSPLKTKVFNCDFDCWNQTCRWIEQKVLIKRYIKKDATFQNFRALGIVTQDRKPLILQKCLFPQVERFWMRPKWKNWALYSCGRVSGNLEENLLYLHFSIFPQFENHRTTCSIRSIFKVTSHFLTPKKPG